MSSTYSGAHDDIASFKSLGQFIQRDPSWMIGTGSRSSVSSASQSPSPSSSHQTDDLDLDSLFRRLDKYTSEMEEVEERLRQARSTSQSSGGVNVKRFAFEVAHRPGEKQTASASHSCREPRRSPSPEVPQRELNSLLRDHTPACIPSESISEVVSDRQTSVSEMFEETPIQTGAEGEEGFRERAERSCSPNEVLPSRSSSRYSDKPGPHRKSGHQIFVWEKQSPSPPSNESQRVPGAQHHPDSIVAPKRQSSGE